MHFAYPLPWWLAVLLAAAIAAVAYGEYRRPLSPLTRDQRGVLVALRVLALAILVLFLFRPIAILPPAGSRDAVVPILVDVSRSMRLGDADGQTRVARADALLKNELGAALSSHFTTELYTRRRRAAPAKVDGLTADCAAHRSQPARSPPCASGIAASASPASSCSPMAGIRAGRVGLVGRVGQEAVAGQAERRAGRRCLRSASDRPTVRAIARCSASRPAIRGSITRRSICTCPR